MAVGCRSAGNRYLRLIALGTVVTLAAVEWLRTTLAMYGRAGQKGAELALRNWPMFAAIIAYAVLLRAVTVVAVLLGPLGGILLYLATAVCLGSFLASVEAIVRTGKATLADFRDSFGRYFSDVIGVMFALWIFNLATSMLAATPNGQAIAAFSAIVVWVLFNAVPELIYLGHYSTMELLGESYSFVTQNWIEWFPPNIALGLGMALLLSLPFEGIVGLLLRTVAAGVFLYFAMVVRGLLFLELADSSRRGRIFRHRAGS